MRELGWEDRAGHRSSSPRGLAETRPSWAGAPSQRMLQEEAARPVLRGWLCGAVSRLMCSKSKNNYCTTARTAT